MWELAISETMDGNGVMLSIEPNIVRQFGSADIAGSGLVSGWSGVEEGHQWNDGFTAEMLIETAPPYGPVTLSFEGEPYLSRRVVRQDVYLFANGMFLGFWRLTAPGSATIEASVAPEQCWARRNRATLKLAVHLPNSARPAEIGDGQDGRCLGFAFRTFMLRQSVRSTGGLAITSLQGK